jgi:hypothetical protein
MTFTSDEIKTKLVKKNVVSDKKVCEFVREMILKIEDELMEERSLEYENVLRVADSKVGEEIFNLSEEDDFSLDN